MARNETPEDLLRMTKADLEACLMDETRRKLRPHVIAKALAVAIRDSLVDRINLLAQHCHCVLTSYDDEGLDRTLSLVINPMVAALEEWMEGQLVTIKEFGVYDTDLVTTFRCISKRYGEDVVVLNLQKLPTPYAPNPLPVPAFNRSINILLGAPDHTDTRTIGLDYLHGMVRLYLGRLNTQEDPGESWSSA